MRQQPCVWQEPPRLARGGSHVCVTEMVCIEEWYRIRAHTHFIYYCILFLFFFLFAFSSLKAISYYTLPYKIKSAGVVPDKNSTYFVINFRSITGKKYPLMYISSFHLFYAVVFVVFLHFAVYSIHNIYKGGSMRRHFWRCFYMRLAAVWMVARYDLCFWRKYHENGWATIR